MPFPPPVSSLLALTNKLRHRAVATASIWYVIVVGIILALLGRTDYADQRRYRNFDLMLANLQHLSTDEIVIVDIDRRTLAAWGRWPWGRDRLATLVEAIAAGKPRSIGIVTPLEGPDERSPAALARRLGEITGRDEIAGLAHALPDGDRRLASALAGAPTSLGVVLSAERTGDWVPKAAVRARGPQQDWGFPAATGLVGPIAELGDAAAGLGVLLLPADADGRVRKAPVAVSVGGRLWPSLAVEVVRAYDGAAPAQLSADGRRLEIAQRRVALDRDGMLRLVPLRHALWAQRTVSALDVVEAPAARPRLAGRIVLVGSSAPQVGELRVAVSGPAVPAVLLHAGAVEQLLTSNAPIRNAVIENAETAAAIGACLIAILLAHVLSPLLGGIATGVLATAWALSAPVLLSRYRLLIDPFLVPIILVTCFTGAGFLTAAASKRRERAMRRRFEQHLAPEVVSRLVKNPELLRLEGELREITALFTDIEGFTAMTGKVEPRVLVGFLDGYFEGVSRVVVEHGGMVEKIVGDGLHAIFNAPLDLADHPRRAVDCAIAIRDFGEQFRGEAEVAAAGFGRTRVGIETGMVVVGDVGGGRKLDYTAHGEAMNMAARFEQANKELGSSICVGPAAASRLPNSALRPLGHLVVRGRSAPAAVFDPWPEATPKAEREAYLRALALAETDPFAAADRIEELIRGSAHDRALATLVARLRNAGISTQLANFDASRSP